MKIYTVHYNPDSPNPLENIILVKEGFSWMASLLNFFWSLYHKMWLVSGVLFGFEIIMAFLEAQDYLQHDTIQAVRFGILLYFGANFNDWYRHSLTKKGYEFQGVISGKNEDEARYKFMSDMLQRTTFVSGNGLLSLI